MDAVNLVVLACVLRVATKKTGGQLLGGKVHPRENPGYLTAPNSVHSITLIVVLYKTDSRLLYSSNAFLELRMRARLCVNSLTAINFRPRYGPIYSAENMAIFTQ